MTAKDEEDFPHGDVFVRMFQDRLKMGRIEDDGQPRMLRWDEETRQAFRDAGEEFAKHWRLEMQRSIGVPQEVHVDHHSALGELLPWIKAQRLKAEKQAEFWETLLRENVKRGISAGFWLLVVAACLGLSGAWRLFLPQLAQ